MPLYRPQELTDFLHKLGRGAKRTLSQNFLIDGNIARKIVETVFVEPEDIIVEIGPGPGVLTELLLHKLTVHPSHQSSPHEISSGVLLAIEKDSQFAHALPRLLQGLRDNTDDEKASNPSHLACLVAIADDVLNIDFSQLLAPYFDRSKKSRKAKLVSNLPYHLTTPILEHIFRFKECFSSITVMVQHEVGQKMTAQDPSSPHFSYLSLFVSYYARTDYVFQVAKTCFSPIPKVQSCVVHMSMKNTFEFASSSEERAFFHFVHNIFSQRRKTIQHHMKEQLQQTTDAIVGYLQQQNIAITTRPDMLRLCDWIFLYRVKNQIKNMKSLSVLPSEYKE